MSKQIQTKLEKKKKLPFFLKIVFPAIVTMLLFISALFFVIIPSFRNTMMQDKKDMIKELSETAWSILNEYAEQEKSGKLTIKAAQAKAISEINGLRYGSNMKDYFWISDMIPRMITHPYRPELNGTDMSTFTDAHNKKVFIEFVKIVKRQHEGYIEYYWQWKDNPDKIVPKLSYVKEFVPWQWIIGTGIYLEDVESDIKNITNRIIIISVIIAIITIFLMILVIYHSHTIEKERQINQKALSIAKEKYQALVESAPEAFILILDEKFNYANKTALEILKYSEQELLNLNIMDIIPPANTTQREKLIQLIKDHNDETSIETTLYCGDKTEVNVVLSISKVVLQGKNGFIIIVHEANSAYMNSKLARQKKLAEEQKELIIDLQTKSRLAGNQLADWEAVATASSAEELIQLRNGFPVKLKALIDAGINVENLTGITSQMVDAVTIRFIELAIAELGEPPTKFSFIIFGSEGRSEQTLKTDQDNAIIYRIPEDYQNIDSLKKYFLALGTKVCDWLNDAGYSYCKGGNMAKNEKWVLSIDEWNNCFQGWIESASPNDLLRINIFFDFRNLYGDISFADNLWSFINKSIAARPEFLIYFVQDALLYKPPITIFGTIALRDKGDNKETISIKEVISSIVQFARIYALKYQINETNTLERLRLLSENEFISSITYREISEVYKLLMQLRFKHQAMALENGEEPDNRINPKTLTDIEREILKKSFSAINSFQTKISYDFKGTI